MNILDCTDIWFRYQESGPYVLKSVSLSIGKGTTTAILGPNGAGKSTFLDICLGWTKPKRGSIHIFNKPLETYTRREMGKILGLVPQNERVQFDYTILEYLLLGRTPYLRQLEMPGKKDIARAEESLRTVGIESLRDRPVTSLSGGEHQLLMIARALTQDPKILILDEPTSQLDPGNRLCIEELLDKLKATGVTVLFTTHDPTLAASAADHVILLRKGELLFAGTEEEGMTTEKLTLLYGVPMEVVRISGRTVVLLPETGNGTGGNGTAGLA